MSDGASRSDHTDQHYTIRPLQSSDREDVQSLWERRFGVQQTDEWIEDSPDSDSSAVGYVAVDDNEIVGAVVGDVISDNSDWVDDYIGGAIAAQSLPTTVTILHLLATAERRTNEGIATALTTEFMDWDSSNDSELILATSWRRENAPDSAPIFEKFGFSPVVTQPNFYTDWRTNCPDCGPGTACSCRATVFVNWRGTRTTDTQATQRVLQ